MFCKESRIWVGKKNDNNEAVKYLFHCEFCIRITVQKYQKQPLRGVPSKCFFSKVGKSLKRTCEIVRFIVKLQVENLKLY